MTFRRSQEMGDEYRETTGRYNGSTTLVYAMVGEAGALVNRTSCRKSSQSPVHWFAAHRLANAPSSSLGRLRTMPPSYDGASDSTSTRSRPPDAGVRGLQEHFAQLLEQFDPHKFAARPAPPPMRVPLTERVGQEAAHPRDRPHHRSRPHLLAHGLYPESEPGEHRARHE